MNPIEPQDRPPRLRPDAPLRIDARNCIPRRYPLIQCGRCRDACPVGVLTLFDASDATPGPQLAQGCLGCGRCVAACPTEALHLPGFLAPPVSAQGPLTIDCWRVPLADSPPGALRVPCLGGLTATWLLERVRDCDNRPVGLLDRGFCQRCAAGGPEHPTSSALREAEAILATLGIPPARWPKLVPQLLPPQRMEVGTGEPLLESRISRRSLLTGIGRVVSNQAGTMDTASRTTQPPSNSPPRRRFAALHGLSQAPYLPASLFPTLAVSADCANHGLCAACPTGALQQYRVEGLQGTCFDAAACVACGLCTQICPEQALTLIAACDAEVAYTGPFALSQFRVRTCPECGADYPDEGLLCPACLKDQSFARDAFRALFGAAAR